MIELLVEAGADLTLLDVCGRTALDVATANGELECARVLSGGGAMAVAEQQ